MSITARNDGHILRFLLTFLPLVLLSIPAAAALDPPHDASTATGCLSCHDLESSEPKHLPVMGHTPSDLDDSLANNLCWSCHNDVDAPFMPTHSSLQTDADYGDWTVECWVCHNQHTQEQNRDHGSTYGQFIRSTVVLDHITGTAKSGTRNVVFTGQTGPNSFADGDATIDGICEICHTQTDHWQNDGSLAGVTEHEGLEGSNCIACHPHSEGFRAVYECLDCHDDASNSETNVTRAAVDQQFSGNSHHVQRTDGSIASSDCYQCHWEADANGRVTDYHTATPGAAVDLVIYGSTARPATYTGNVVLYTTGITSSQALNSHCLGCHDDDTKSVDVFGDGKYPNFYAWDESSDGARDGTSVKARYAQTGTTAWGKYTATARAAQKNIPKAFSAHGNAGSNARGWDTTNGVDGTITDTSGSVQVACFDCHNSHGSTVSGITTSYDSATTNGGILKDTVAGKGGYTGTYKPAAGGSTADNNAHNPGAALCFDCHMNPTAGPQPWGYQETFNAGQMIMGYWDSPYFGPGTFGPQQRFAYKANQGHKGGHFGASSATVNDYSATPINGLCTPCHDPHGVSPALGTNQQYSVPLLKGTWITSPYKEDAAPATTDEYRGGYRHSWWGASNPGYKIDQNTFANWNFSSTAGVSQTAGQFAGLCLQCHAKTDLDPDTSGKGTWKSVDRIHDTVSGWGGAKHRYSCSKCHTPHNSRLPRLMVSNCLDYNHRGRVASGGSPGSHSGSGSGASGSGSGSGRFPAGGSGSGTGYLGPRSYSFLFGNQSCHGGTWPSGELWNNATPW